MKSLFVTFGFLSLLPSAAADGNPPSNSLSFNRHIRPVLSKNCLACHGLDKKKRKAGLRLDTREGALADLGGYRAIEPGKPEKSEAWLRINSTDPDDVMPPPEHHHELSPKDKSLLHRWISEGADYEAHWSFIPPKKPPVPEALPGTNPIDAFIQARLKKEGVQPAPRASKESLIRRVTLDLTGLPPTPEEVDRFLADQSPAAWPNLIDELMSRSRHGEHMARYWLDLARYADTHGLHLDNERSMWPYRDWVVEAFNKNLPFDVFTRWQLAGDLHTDPSREQLIASGFNRCNVTTSEGGSINEEWIYRYAVDRTSTAIEVWMGLTAGCAVCHDHKFDPLTMRDFYSLYAFFHSAADPAMDGNKTDTPPILKLTAPEQQKRIERLDAEIAKVEKEISKRLNETSYTDPASLDPPPNSETVETVWFEDNFPPNTKPVASGHPLKLISSGEGPVFSGNKALRRTADEAVAQDYFQGGVNLTVPKDGHFFVHAFLDSKNPPKTVMVQFHVGGWKNRAVWGEPDKIPFGKAGTTEKVSMGALPDTGKWVRLEFPAAKIGLKAGTKVTGYAFTQYGGSVTWDRLGICSTINPSTDPEWSWEVWKKQNQGKRNNLLPEGLRQLVRGKQSDQWSKNETKQVFDHWLRHFYAGVRPSLEPLEAKQAPFKKEKEEIEKKTPITFVMADLPKPRESFIMNRGQYDNPGEKVSRAAPAFLPGLPKKPKDRDYNRLDLANWLVSPRHPLTARVAVNRLWQQFFGTGLVKTSADFGSQGELPSHPALLDWLAVQWVEDGWDRRKIIKRILTSQTYQQDSRVSPELLSRDPENRLLARGARFRLDAEVLRDQALFVSGLLVEKIGGKGVKPYQPPNIWEPVGFGNSNTRYYKQDTGEALYRRSLYTFLKRTAPPPFMTSFDAPNREQSCPSRGVSNTPLQALQLMNDIQHVEAARHLGQRMIKEGGSSDVEKIRWAWRVVAARYPNEDEIRVARNTLVQHRNRYQSDTEAAHELINYGESKPDQSIPPHQLAAYTLLANLLLNLDETVTK